LPSRSSGEDSPMAPGRNLCPEDPTREGTLSRNWPDSEDPRPPAGLYPQAWLIGWKYELEGTRPEALARGREQLRACATDACVVNGDAYGPGFGVLSAADPDGTHCPDERALCERLAAFVTSQSRPRHPGLCRPSASLRASAASVDAFPVH